jgi:hypothetical protein
MDETELLYNEGDVVRATSLYLVYLVNRVLVRLFPRLAAAYVAKAR